MSVPPLSSINYNPCMPEIARAYGRMHLCNEIESLSSSRLLETILSPELSVNEQHNMGTTKDPGLPRVVDKFACPSPARTVVTDASALGWGAQLGTLKVQSFWTEQETFFHFNVLEFQAIYNVC